MTANEIQKWWYPLRAPTCLISKRALWGYPNKYPLYKVYAGVDYQGYHPKGTTIFPVIKREFPFSSPENLPIFDRCLNATFYPQMFCKDMFYFFVTLNSKITCETPAQTKLRPFQEFLQKEIHNISCWIPLFPSRKTAKYGPTLCPNVRSLVFLGTSALGRLGK